MDFLKEIKDRILVYDGSKGYLLQKMGLSGGECPELWNVTHRNEVEEVYRLYKKAGADVIQTNSFQGNRIKLKEYSLEDKTYELNYESARLAREVMAKDGFVSGSIGPIGILLEPSGDLTFELAYETYKEQVKALIDGGVDIINFETFTDLAEMRIALLATKENFDIPVICSISFESNGRTLMGSDPYTMVTVLKSLGADMVGTNCALGPQHLIDIAKKMHDAGGMALSIKPNAGLPEMINGSVCYKESPQNFAAIASEFVKYGARLIGGCCGTTPEHIAAIKGSILDLKAPELVKKCEKVITSNVKSLIINDEEGINAGGINTSSNEELSSNLREGNLDYIIDIAFDLSCGDSDAVYLNVDSASKEDTLLSQVVNTLHGYTKQPIIIETKNYKALDQALRVYRGKAGVVVGNDTPEIMEGLLRVAKKYGSTIVDSETLKMG